MKIIRDTTEDDMVAAFLKAEINSLRWGSKIINLLHKYSADRKIIDEPNLNDNEENNLRTKILSDSRGYKKNEGLFKNFPNKINWKRVELNKQDIDEVKYIDYDYWVKLSGGSRRVKDGVKNIKKGLVVFGESNEQFIKLAEYIREGGSFPEIILMCNNTGELVLLEGHVRLTSYLLANDDPNPLEVIIGYPIS